MSATLFDHTDRDGDSMTVYKRAAHCVAEPIAITIRVIVKSCGSRDV